MNDFTKGELEEIYFRLENAPQELEDKIKSLIDNYCEHELEPFSSFREICIKCKGIF